MRFSVPKLCPKSEKLLAYGQFSGGRMQNSVGFQMIRLSFIFVSRSPEDRRERLRGGRGVRPPMSEGNIRLAAPRKVEAS